MQPTMTVDIKTPAPNKAPKAKPASPSLALPTAAIALKTSGAPFPNARNVTPFEQNKVKEKYSVNNKISKWK